MDKYEKIVLNVSATSIAVMAMFVAVVSLAKVLLLPEMRSFKRAVTSIFIGWPIGILGGLIAVEWGAGQYTAIAIGCLTSLISENLILAILNSDFSKIAGRALGNLVDKWTK